MAEVDPPPNANDGRTGPLCSRRIKARRPVAPDMRTVVWGNAASIPPTSAGAHFTAMSAVKV